MRQFYVYILASRSRTLYVGVTSDLVKRLYQHRNGESTFTSKYRIHRLVHFECTQNSLAAIQREKQIKSWTRAKKVALIERDNPLWQDLGADLSIDGRSQPQGGGNGGTADSSLRSE